MADNEEMGKNNLIEQDTAGQAPPSLSLTLYPLPCLLTLFDVGLDPWGASLVVMSPRRGVAC